MKHLPLLLATTMLAGLASCEHEAKPPAPTPSPTPANHLAVPGQGAYTGAYIDFGEVEDLVKLEDIEAFEQAVGKHQAIIASSSYWGEQSFPARNLRLITHHGSIPLVFWSPWDKPYTQERPPDRFSLNAILDGKWDAYIDQWADQAKAFERPFFVAWGLEMNGIWFPWSGTFYGGGDKVDGDHFAGPEIYKKAYRYVVDRTRARGAKNILWVFQTNNSSVPNEKWNAMKEYYPGDDYVDWLGMSAYGMQYRDANWTSAEDTFLKAYNELSKLNPTKPIMLAEWGVGEFPHAGDKAAWITNAFQLMSTRFPRMKAAIFWHERWENEDGTFSNLRVTSSPQALAAYRAGVASPFWLDQPIYR